MIEYRRQAQTQIQKRLKRSQAEGDLSKDVSVGDLTRYITVVLNGLGVQAANGATKAEMSRVVEMAMRTLPL